MSNIPPPGDLSSCQISQGMVLYSVMFHQYLYTNSPCIKLILFDKQLFQSLQKCIDSLNPSSGNVSFLAPFSASVRVGLLFQPDNNVRENEIMLIRMILWDIQPMFDDNDVLIFYTVIYCHYAEHTDELQLDDNGMIKILRRSSYSCTCVCVCVCMRVCRYTYVCICVYVV
jgi:hypothetical protein